MPFFHFFEYNRKNETTVRINITFFSFPFFYFGGKMEKKKNELGIEDYFIFLTSIRKMKKYQFSRPFSFFLYLKIYKYDKAK